MSKNVTIKQYDGSSYDEILPKTSASQTTYSNTTSGMSATTVQGAVDELNTKTRWLDWELFYTGSDTVNNYYISNSTYSYRAIASYDQQAIHQLIKNYYLIRMDIIFNTGCSVTPDQASGTCVLGISGSERGKHGYSPVKLWFYNPNYTLLSPYTASVLLFRKGHNVGTYLDGYEQLLFSNITTGTSVSLDEGSCYEIQTYTDSPYDKNFLYYAHTGSSSENFTFSGTITVNLYGK